MNGQSNGIGLANVAGRMKVLYGEGAAMTVTTSASGGTLVRIALPDLDGSPLYAERGEAAHAEQVARVGKG